MIGPFNDRHPSRRHYTCFTRCKLARRLAHSGPQNAGAVASGQGVPPPFGHHSRASLRPCCAPSAHCGPASWRDPATPSIGQENTLALDPLLVEGGRLCIWLPRPLHAGSRGARRTRHGRGRRLAAPRAWRRSGRSGGAVGVRPRSAAFQARSRGARPWITVCNHCTREGKGGRGSGGGVVAGGASDGHWRGGGGAASRWPPGHPPHVTAGPRPPPAPPRPVRARRAVSVCQPRLRRRVAAASLPGLGACVPLARGGGGGGGREGGEGTVGAFVPTFAVPPRPGVWERSRMSPLFPLHFAAGADARGVSVCCLALAACGGRGKECSVSPHCTLS